MGQFLKTFAKNESGATAIEYALIAAGIAIVIIAAIGSVGDALIAKFEEIAAALA